MTVLNVAFNNNSEQKEVGETVRFGKIVFFSMTLKKKRPGKTFHVTNWKPCADLERERSWKSIEQGYSIFIGLRDQVSEMIGKSNQGHWTALESMK